MADRDHPKVGGVDKITVTGPYKAYVTSGNTDAQTFSIVAVNADSTPLTSDGSPDCWRAFGDRARDDRRSVRRRKDVKQAVVREILQELRPLANDIRQRFRDLGRTGARVATTVRVSTGGQSAKVSMGSAKHPYSLGREFGAKRNVTRPFFRRVQSGSFSTRRVGAASGA